MKSFIFIFIFFITILSVNLYGQTEITPEKLGLSAHTIANKNLGEINYYIKGVEKDKPLIIYLDGSGSFPLYQKVSQGIASTVPLNSKEISDKYNIVMIGKPGIPFIDEVGRNEKTGIPEYPAPAEYTKRLSLDWRVDSAKLVIDEVLGKLKYKPKKIIVLGLSEGFQVGAKLASIDKRITHLGIFVGNGLNQFYDFIVENRLRAERGEISTEEAQKNIDELFAVYKEIYANPNSTDKEWFGHTYKRWASFTNNISLGKSA